MYEVIFLIVLGIIWISFASIQDLRKREVDDWLSYSLIVFALGFRFFYCLFEKGEIGFFYQGLIGLGIFFVIGNLFYYGRFFAGGDAKLMIAIGTILPLSDSFFNNLQTFSVFFIIFLFAGAVYGLIWSLILAFSNYKKFKKEFLRQVKENSKIIKIIWLIGILIFVYGLFMNNLFLIIGLLFFIFEYLFIFAKAVEEVCMVRKIQAKFLTEGDWLYQDIKIRGKMIKAKWGGLNSREIKLLRKYKRYVLIKQGIPFVPVFWISFLVWIYLRNSFW